MQQKITPNLWFDGNAKEAVDFYVAVFPESRILTTSHYPQSVDKGLAEFQLPLAGKELFIEFELGGLKLGAINAGPEFKPNPSISFFVYFKPEDRASLDRLWEKLLEGGVALMPLQAYPFSPYYGWVQDRYGISWQLNLAAEFRARLVPSLMFTQAQSRRAEEAMRFYSSIFQDSQVGNLARYPQEAGPMAGAVMYGEFQLAGQPFAAMDVGQEHGFSFNEGVSLSISCRDQAEIDHFWSKLSTVIQAEQCGWCKDAYGVSWQVVPENMGELMQRPDAFARMMEMKKLVIADF
ncbi:MAG: VOC family protein [Vulcanimicrobiota bacterium]